MRPGMLAVALAGLGCGPAVGTPTGDDATDGSSTTTGSTTSTPSTTTETTSATTDTDASSGSSSGEPLDGPGCGVVPTCDRGELVGSMRIESSAQIEDIAGYTSVTGWLEISSSDLECLDFLACIESVGRDVLVADNPMLRSLDGLDGLMQVGASPDAKESGVIVAHNDALRELDGFGALVRVDSLVVEDNPMLDRITGFDALERIRESLTIRLHPVLQDLGTLADLRALGNECQITNNPMLCVAQAYAVCGDLEQGSDEGSTANNDEGCLGDAPPGFIPTHEGWGECSPWAQNCPPGEKCTWWANDGGNAWNATRCVPVDPEAVDVGESCTVQGSGVTGLDDCDIGQMCWNVDRDTNVGRCVAFCIGNESAPFCGHVDETCRISSDGLAFCLTSCDPLAQDCPAGEGCYFPSGTFSCAPDTSADLGAAGDPCEYVNACDPGLFCAAPQTVPGCTTAGCCSPYCDLPAPACPFPEQECVPVYEPAESPWGDEDVGVCVVPA